jgi:hypothetical protein
LTDACKQTNKHTISFEHVWHWTQKASEIYRSKTKVDEASDLHVPLLDIYPEGKLQREVKDILDELDIMLSITRRQREIIRRFCRHVENILDPEGRWRSGLDPGSPSDTGERQTLDGEQQARDAKDREEGKRQDKARRKNHLDWFRMQSQDLLCEVDDRIDELEGLKEAANSTAQSVSDES